MNYQIAALAIAGKLKLSLLVWLTAFALGAVLTPLLIPLLRRLKFGQHIREDGPQGHLKKAGTPTMGGIAFLTAVIICCVIFGLTEKASEIWPVVFMTTGFGLIGFLDDFLEIIKKKNEGLTPKQKLFLQIVLTGIFCAWRMLTVEDATVINIPFVNTTWDMGWLYVPFLFLVVLGTDNGVNLNDGIDGLCSSVTMVVALFFTALSVILEGNLEIVTLAVAGSLLGYLLFNTNPAKLFMGDTGSLALGGFVASTALTLRQPLIILIAGFIYLIETVSVMMQVGYFKYTKKKYGQGRRIFRMTPIHHHFELGGWSEPRIVIVFTAVTAVLCVISFLGIGW